MSEELHDWKPNPYGVAFQHAEIHRTGLGCCCPARDVFCPGCPQHKEQAANRIEVLEAELATTKAAAFVWRGKALETNVQLEEARAALAAAEEYKAIAGRLRGSVGIAYISEAAVFQFVQDYDRLSNPAVGGGE